MVNVVLSLSLLLCVVCVAHGQSTAGDNSGCVYSFKVPTSDCAQTPSPSVDDQLLKSSVIALQAQVKQLASDNKQLREHIEKVDRENQKQASDVEDLKKASQSGSDNHISPICGAVYIRWGRVTCPGNGTTLVYAGVAGGSWYDHTGGGADYLCLPRDPDWGEKTTAGFRTYASYLYGAEYQILPEPNYFSTTNAQSLEQNDVPCAVCLVTSRPVKLMVPAKLTCPSGWTREYSGYLMAAYHNHKGRTSHVCMDNDPEVVEGGAANENGALFYYVEAKCGSLSCPKYKDGWEVTCVVCSK